jgi:hypothetical protein
MRYFRFSRTLLLVTFTVLGISNTLLASDISSKAQPLYGKDSTLGVNKTITIADNILLNATGWSVNNVKNLVTFKIDEFSNLVLPDSFKVTIIYKNDYKVWPSTTLFTKNDTLVLTYNKNNTYTNKAMAVKPGVYYSSVTVLSITANYTTIPLTSFVKTLMLENEVQSSRYFVNFDCDINAIKTISKDVQFVNADGELLISWPAVIEADEYDLEWAVIDLAALPQYYIDNTTNPDPNKIFDNNATRVTLGADRINYKIPLIYEKNTIVFVRIRPAQVLIKNQRKEANWSSNYSGGMERYDFTTGLEATLNWQATTSFAEDGKRKSVVQFYDGSLRSRQTVTKDNSKNTTVVAETFYDYEGRPQIQVLPSPTLSSIIKYTPNFNPAINGGEYDKDRYDKLIAEYCGKGAEAMGTQAGAGKYYSPQNPDAATGANKFIPDAKGYPFTETKYTQDGSGQVSEQGGVGAYHQLGQGITADATSQDHQTKYFYGNADQEDLDALFGTEAGLSSHYFKNMVRDANGQYSVSYTDMHGRTVATALAGKPAQTKLQNIASNISRFETKNLLSGGSNVLTDKYTIQSVKSLLVTKASKHKFNYSLLGDSITIKDCNNQNICYDCLYDLEISITDDCNNQRLPGGQPYTFKKSNFTLASFLQNPDTTCDAVNSIIWSDSLFLTEGAYQVTKKLSVNKQAMDAYRSKIFLPHNTCKTEQQFIDSVKTVILNSISCETTCQACTDSIGTWDNYREKFMRKLKIPIQDSASYRELALQSYNAEVVECDELCERNTLENEVLAEMLEDVSPPAGQYASDAGIFGANAYIWSIFHTDFTNQEKIRYQLPSTDYLDEDGAPSIIESKKPEELTPEQFSDNFKNSWAKSLLYLHPEYNRYLRLRKFRNSNAWDADFNNTETYADALAKGYLNPTGSTASPFNTFDPTGSSAISRDPFYQICQDSFSIANKKAAMEILISDVTNGSVSGGVSMWSMATIAAKCGDEDAACFNIYRQNTNAFSSTLCTGDLNIAWQSFRTQYLSRKNKLVYEIVTQSPEADIIPDVPNPDIEGDNAEHILRILTPKDATATGLGNGSGTGEGEQGGGNAQIAEQVAGACNGYVTQWMTDLGTCNYTQLQKDALTIQLLAVCKAGGDETHPSGSSSVSPTSTFTPKSFEEVVNAFNTANGITTNINCNADLITAPLPYNAQELGLDEDEIIIGNPDTCFCNKISGLYSAYSVSPNGTTSFSAYLNAKLNVTITDGDLNKLLALCGSSANGTCNNLDTAIAIPPALQCIKDPCISCVQMQQYYNGFRTKYPGALMVFADTLSATQIAINRLFENYVNHRTGFKKTAYEYVSFMQQCNINTTDTTQPVNCTDLQTVLDNFKTSYINTTYGLPIPLSSQGCDTLSWAFPQYNFASPSGVTYASMFHDGIVGVPENLVPGNVDAGFQFGGKVPCNTNNGIIYEASIKAPLGSVNEIWWRVNYTGGFAEVHISETDTGYTVLSGGGGIKVPLLQQDFSTQFKVLKISYIGSTYKVYVNNLLLYTFLLPGVITDRNVTLQFNRCRGMIDWIKLTEPSGNLILNEQFNNGCSNFAKMPLQFACPPNCTTAFTSFYNTAKGTNLTYTQITALYQQCGINPDPCGAITSCDQLNSIFNTYKAYYTNSAYGLPFPLSSQGCDTLGWRFPSYVFNSITGVTYSSMFHDGMVSIPVSLVPNDDLAGFQLSYNSHITSSNNAPFCNINNGLVMEARIKTLLGANNYGLILFGFNYYLQGNSGPTGLINVYMPSNQPGNFNNSTNFIPQLQHSFSDSFQVLKITYIGNRCSIFASNKLIYSFELPGDIFPPNYGIGLQFRDMRAMVDWIKYTDKDGNVILDEQFNSGCNNFALPPLQYRCPPDCKTGFKNFYNAIKGTSLTYDQIAVLFQQCGIDPDPCGSTIITCSQLQSTVKGYNKSLVNVAYDSTGIENTWQLGLNNYGTAHTPDKYKFRDFIRNGTFSVPDSVTVQKGDFSYKQTIPMCLQKEFAMEWRTRLKPGSLLADLKLQYRFNFGTTDSLRVEFNGTGTNNGFVGATYNTGGQQTSNLTQWVATMAGVQFQNWTRVKIIFRANNQVDCYVDDVLKGSATYNSVLPLRSFEIAGWNNGAYEVDYVKMYNNTGRLVYNEEFTNPQDFAIPPYEWICNKPTDCQGSFTTYFNQKNGTTYTYSQIVNLFKKICNQDLNVCPTAIPFTLKLCATRDSFPDFNPPNKCDLAGNGATDLGTLLYNAYRDSVSNSFTDKYLAKCMNVLGRESFTVTDSASEFHYTLYYYDLAGNLLKTVPPEGVNLAKMGYKQAWSDSVKTARNAGQVLTVPHGLTTQYRYNTLNQVMQQKTPDASISNFWYDRLGRLVVSQNAKQKAISATENLRNYSYTLYDSIGRITEVGEYTNPSTTAMVQAVSRDTAGLRSWLNTNGNKKQVTRTIYDLQNSIWVDLAASVAAPVSAVNLRNRVAFTHYYPLGNPNGLNYSQATYYSYDIHGNVDTLIQDYGNSLSGGGVNMMNNGNGLHNRFKRMVYKYDLISGKVNHVAYQPQYIKGSLLYRPADALYHKYEYDAENRITAVYTSTDSLIWEKDAHYDYYKHGPLARTELGEQLVQGIDYAYTIQGWLKGVNSSSLTPAADIGQDGLSTNPATKNVGRDAFGFNLNYFNGDYSSIGAGAGTNSMPLHTADAGITNGLSSANYRPLYNGNISSMAVNIGKLTIPDATGTTSTSGAILYNYQYDQLNRLVAMDAFKGLTAANNSWANMIALPHYQERITYDGNGNILTYKRNGNKTSQQLMDDLAYFYNKDAAGKIINNRLRHVTDAVTNAAAYDEADPLSGVSDIENQTADNYVYDAIGNLIKDNKENITAINWNVYGKITDINFAFIANKPKKITFGYDAGGNRISKQVEKYGTLSTTATTSAYTWYTRDASGNVMAIYNATGAAAVIPTALSVGERNLYGSSRLGVLNLATDVKILPQLPVGTAYSTNFIRGNKFFELSNHLSNVLVTVSDKKIGVDNNADGIIDYYNADVVTAQDYYPGGMAQPGRIFKQAGKDYRYTINGQEKEKDLNENITTAEYWEYDSRIGRRWNIDPKQKVDESPYLTFSGNPILNSDVDGDEADEANDGGRRRKPKSKPASTVLKNKTPKPPTPPTTPTPNYIKLDLRPSRAGLYQLDGNTPTILDPTKITGKRRPQGNQEPERDGDGVAFTSKYGQGGAPHISEKNRTVANQQTENIDLLMFTVKFADKLKSPKPTVTDPWDWVKLEDKLYGIAKINSTNTPTPTSNQTDVNTKGAMIWQTTHVRYFDTVGKSENVNKMVDSFMYFNPSANNSNNTTAPDTGKVIHFKYPKKKG